MPANEHLTMRIAESFGINVVPSSLIRLQSGELSYITKRIDRIEKGGYFGSVCASIIGLICASDLGSNCATFGHDIHTNYIFTL